MSEPVIVSVPVTVTLNVFRCDTCNPVVELEQDITKTTPGMPPTFTLVCPTCKKEFTSNTLPGVIFTRS